MDAKDAKKFLAQRLRDELEKRRAAREEAQADAVENFSSVPDADDGSSPPADAVGDSIEPKGKGKGKGRKGAAGDEQEEPSSGRAAQPPPEKPAPEATPLADGAEPKTEAEEGGDVPKPKPEEPKPEGPAPKTGGAGAETPKKPKTPKPAPAAGASSADDSGAKERAAEELNAKRQAALRRLLGGAAASAEET